MDQTRTCERCRASFPLDKIKLFPYTKEKNILVCEECCEFLKNRVKMIVAPSKTKVKTKIKTEPKPDYKTKDYSRCKIRI